MRLVMVSVSIVLSWALTAPVWAQAIGPVNPSTMTWTAPTTNDCTGQPTVVCATCNPVVVPTGTTICPTAAPCVLVCTAPLVDLGSYMIRAAGPFAPGAACPAFTPAGYPVKKTIASTTTTPSPNTTITFGVAGSLRLADDLGLTADGQYCATVSAVDNQTPPLESVASAASPFLRSRPAPSAPNVPPAVPSGVLVNP